MYWLCRSWGRRATGLPHRLGEGDGPDVHRVRDLVAQRHVERRHRPDLVEDVRPDIAVGVDAADDVDLRDERVPDLLRLALLGDHGVEAPLLGPHAIEPRLGHAQPGRLREEQQHHAHDHHGRRRARRDQPRVLDRGDEATEIGKGELEPAPRCRPLLLPWEKIYFDHAARLSASPTDSISRGATSSTDTDSNTASRTLSRCTRLATSTGSLSRLPSASFSPGIRAPPPIVYTRPRPPAEREAVARNAAARSTPTAIDRKSVV